MMGMRLPEDILFLSSLFIYLIVTVSTETLVGIVTFTVIVGSRYINTVQFNSG